MAGLINANPVIHERKAARRPPPSTDENAVEEIDALEVFEHLRDIRDPEHPLTLEQLNVVNEDLITVDDKASKVTVTFTPTVQHCSMASLIGLCIRVKLMQSLPPRFKVQIKLAAGSHNSEQAVNKQLNDKERIAAAIESPHLRDTVMECISSLARNEDY